MELAVGMYVRTQGIGPYKKQVKIGKIKNILNKDKIQDLSQRFNIRIR
jgi:hypothetical protein